MNEELNKTLRKLKERSDPWLDFNRRGQLLILLAVTYFVLFLRLMIYFFSGFDLLSFIPPDYTAFDFMSYVNEVSIYVLNIIAFGLIFFWVSRIVTVDVRTGVKVPMTSDERFNFILTASVCFLTLNAALDVSGIFTSPFTILCAGFSFILWIVSVLMDKFILDGTFIRFYFLFLTIVIVGVVIFDSIFYFLF